MTLLWSTVTGLRWHKCTASCTTSTPNEDRSDSPKLTIFQEHHLPMHAERSTVLAKEALAWIFCNG